MVRTIRLDDRLSVAAQLVADDFAALAKAGFRSIINNRPDYEEPLQLGHEDAAELAEAAGLAYDYLPMTAADLSPELVDQFGALLDSSPAPVLAHCRSGTRCTVLWALLMARRGTLAVDEIITRAGEAGYDLAAQRPLILAYRDDQG